jgi:hypothetical protein
MAGLIVPVAGTAAQPSMAPLQPQATATRAIPANRLSPCTGLVTATVSTGHIRLCDEAEITVSMWPTCTVCPGGINVVFVQVEQAHEAQWMNRQSVAALEQLESYPGQAIRVGVVHYTSVSVRRVLPLTDNLSRATGWLSRGREGHDPAADYVGAAGEAVAMLKEARRTFAPEAGGTVVEPCEIVIFFAYAKTTLPTYEAKIREAGKMITREGIVLMAGCPMNFPAEHCRATRDMPDPKNYYTEFNEGGKLQGFVANEMDRLLRKTGLSGLALWQRLPSGLQFIDDSASEAPVLTTAPDASVTLSWDWPRLTQTLAHTVTYRVRPLAEGNWPIAGLATLRDKSNKTRELPVATQAITVSGDCPPPTPTELPPPTETPEPPVTNTPEPSPTTTPTSTATATPTHTPTRVPRPIYLPVILNESCTETSIYSDVVLVLDMSTSMNRSETGGRTKLVATLDAATDFLNRMDFTPDNDGRHDRVAVVGFNNTAWIELPLSGDKEAVARAIAALPAKQAEATRLDLAFLRGNDALVGHSPTSTPVLIMLTDGLPNRVPPAEDGRMETTVLRAAQVAKTAGATVYTIGIGQPTDIDPVLLRDSASRPENYFYTPDPEELNGIYKQIAFTFGCPKDRHDWGKPWPPGARGAQLPGGSKPLTVSGESAQITTGSEPRGRY